jgi:hypothetical protein
VQTPLQAATTGGNPGCVYVRTAHSRRLKKGANLGQKTLMRRNLIVVKRVRVVIAVDCHVILVEGAELCFRVARMHLSR